MKVAEVLRPGMYAIVLASLILSTAHAQRTSSSESAGSRTQAPSAESVRILRDVPYKKDAATSYERERCQLDWYLPAGVTDFPTIVWFHGGGLRGGDKSGDIAVALAKRFAGDGIAVATVNYRLSPKVKYPAYLEDAAAAVAFVHAKVAAHGGSADRVFVSGHSAGGYLTSMIGLRPDFLKPHGLTRNSLAGWIPVSGQMITHSTVREEREIPRTRPIIDEAAPAFHATAETGPFLCIAGDQDLPARSEENRYFVAVMKAAGHSAIRFVEFAGRDHGTIASQMSEPDDEVARMIVQFIHETASARTPTAKPAAK